MIESDRSAYPEAFLGAVLAGAAGLLVGGFGAGVSGMFAAQPAGGRPDAGVTTGALALWSIATPLGCWVYLRARRVAGRRPTGMAVAFLTVPVGVFAVAQAAGVVRTGLETTAFPGMAALRAIGQIPYVNQGGSAGQLPWLALTSGLGGLAALVSRFAVWRYGRASVRSKLLAPLILLLVLGQAGTWLFVGDLEGRRLTYAHEVARRQVEDDVEGFLSRAGVATLSRIATDIAKHSESVRAVREGDAGALAGVISDAGIGSLDRKVGVAIVDVRGTTLARAGSERVPDSWTAPNVRAAVAGAPGTVVGIVDLSAGAIEREVRAADPAFPRWAAPGEWALVAAHSIAGEKAAGGGAVAFARLSTLGWDSFVYTYDTSGRLRWPPDARAPEDMWHDRSRPPEELNISPQVGLVGPRMWTHRRSLPAVDFPPGTADAASSRAAEAFGWGALPGERNLRVVAVLMPSFAPELTSRGTLWRASLVLALTTLALAGLVALYVHFVVRPIQRLADAGSAPRRGATLHPEEVGRLAEELRLGAVGGLVTGVGSGTDLEQSLAATLRDPTVRVVRWDASRRVYVDWAGSRVDVPEADTTDRAVEVVVRAGIRIGAVVFDPRLRAESRLVEAAVGSVSLVLENERLAAARVDEVNASRVRLVEATLRERHKLERDIHDGAQQQFVLSALALGRVESLLGADADATARQALGEASRTLQAGLSELRELARGIYPSVLTQDGLRSAIQSASARLSIPVEVDVNVGRYATAVEGTAYFVTMEALTNVVKHARATHARVEMRQVNGLIAMSVADDGIGGASLETPGSGLRGMQDRVRALGGDLRIESSPGDGTIVWAELPCD